MKVHLAFCSAFVVLEMSVTLVSLLSLPVLLSDCPSPPPSPPHQCVLYIVLDSSCPWFCFQSITIV